MGKRSKVKMLPPEVRKRLEKFLVDNNFSGYERLADDLAALGFPIGKSSLHRFGSDLERRLAAVKAATEGAIAMAAAAPDDEAQLSTAVLSMVQTDVFNIMMRLREADEGDPVKRARLLAGLAKDMATAGRAQILLKKFQSEIRTKTQAAADKVAAMAKKGGMSAGTVDMIRREILGIAPA